MLQFTLRLYLIVVVVFAIVFKPRQIILSALHLSALDLSASDLYSDTSLGCGISMGFTRINGSMQNGGKIGPQSSLYIYIGILVHTTRRRLRIFSLALTQSFECGLVTCRYRIHFIGLVIVLTLSNASVYCK